MKELNVSGIELRILIDLISALIESSAYCEYDACVVGRKKLKTFFEQQDDHPALRALLRTCLDGFEQDIKTRLIQNFPELESLYSN